MKQVCLLVLCGVPASGKSTLSEHLYRLQHDETHPASVNQYLVIHYDDVIAADTEHMRHDRAALLLEVERLIGRVQSGSSGDGDVPPLCRYRCHLSGLDADPRPVCIVLDDNMYYRSMRYEVYSAARRQRCSYVVCHLDADLPAALERNRSRLRGARIPDEVVQRMQEKLEAPPAAFERDYARYAGEPDMSRLLEVIRESLLNAVPALRSTRCERLVVPLTDAHRYDLIVRGLVNSRMKENAAKMDGSQLKRDADLLVIGKAKLLKSIKNHEMQGLDDLSQLDLYEFLDSLLDLV